MAAYATEEELGAVRERLADFDDPFDGKWDEGEGLPGTGEDPGAAQGLDTREAAAWLGLSPKTLERYRVSDEGPDFQRIGARVRYLLEDLEAWASARRRKEPPGGKKTVARFQRSGRGHVAPRVDGCHERDGNAGKKLSDFRVS